MSSSDRWDDFIEGTRPFNLDDMLETARGQAAADKAVIDSYNPTPVPSCRLCGDLLTIVDRGGRCRQCVLEGRTE